MLCLTTTCSWPNAYTGDAECEEPGEKNPGQKKFEGLRLFEMV